MRGFQRSRARQPGHLSTAREAAGDLRYARELITNLPDGNLRDELLDKAVGSAAVLHSALSGISRPGGASPRDIGLQLTEVQGRPSTEVYAGGYDVVRAAEAFLGVAATEGAGAEINYNELTDSYA